VELQKAIDAGKTTGVPTERGGLARTLASIGAGGAAALGANGLLGTAGVAALPFTAMLTSALHDPSFIRAVAGRRITADNIAGLLTQYVQHAGLGTTPDQVDPVETLRAGVGKAANAAASVPGLAASMLKYVSGGQR
jgi:hypothetical protein